MSHVGKLISLCFVFLFTIPAHSQNIWLRCSNGLVADTILSLTQSGKYIYAGTQSQGVYRTSDNGSSWQAASAPDEFKRTQTWCMASLDTFIYAGQRGRGVYRTSINSGTWTQIVTGMTNKFVMDLEVRNHEIFAATYGGGVYQSTDTNDSWKQFIGNKDLDDLYVFSLTSAYFAVWCGTAGRNTIPDTGVVYINNEYSGSWIPKNNGFVRNGVHLDGVFSLDATDSVIFAGTDDVGLYRSFNVGNNWERVDSNHGDVHSIKIVGHTIYFGTSYSGIYLSTDNGDSWQANNNGLSFGQTSLPYLVKDLLQVGDTMFAATDIGVFKQAIPKPQTSVADHTMEASIKVYPNPFSRQATVSITISKPEKVTLSVVDILGNTIKTIIDEQMSSGDQTFEVGDLLPNGAYFLIYQTPNERKVIPLYHIQE